MDIYKKDFYNLCSFTIYAHGFITGSDWEMKNPWQRLTGGEVEDLWYTGSEGSNDIFVYPSDMIILAKSCWGMINNVMADAFVDYGATAFCGVRVGDKPFEHMDLKYLGGTRRYGFWGSLCRQNSNVRVSSQNLVTNRNYIMAPAGWAPWTYGDHFKVVGNQYATLA